MKSRIKCVGSQQDTVTTHHGEGRKTLCTKESQAGFQHGNTLSPLSLSPRRQKTRQAPLERTPSTVTAGISCCCCWSFCCCRCHDVDVVISSVVMWLPCTRHVRRDRCTNQEEDQQETAVVAHFVDFMHW